MPVRDYPTFKKSAIRYWERRRLIYNLALTLPSYYTYSAAMRHLADRDVKFHFAYLLGTFAFAALCANICYSFAYAMEFLFGNDDLKSKWLLFGRAGTFVVGILLSVVLAAMTAYQIADFEWTYWYS